MPRRDGFGLRLGFSYALVLLLMVVSAAWAVYTAFVAAERRDHTTASYVSDTVYAERLNRATMELIAAARGYVISGTPLRHSQMGEARGTFERALGEVQRGLRFEEGEELLSQVVRSATRYERTIERLVMLRGEQPAGSSQNEVAAFFEREMLPSHRELAEALDTFVAYKESLIEPATQKADRAFRRALALSAGALVFALLASVVVASRSARQLSRSYLKEREATRIAEHAVSVRDEMLAMVAHDLRSPLNAISLKAGLIRKDATRAGQYAESIKGIALRMERLIRTMLDAASIEADQFSVNAVPCDVADLLRDANELFASAATAKSIRLEVQLVPPAEELGVLADRGRVLQAFSNLLENALKFTPEDGTVTVCAKRDEDRVRFAVSNTGPEIEPAHLPHLFDRYWRPETGRKRGTGLGLYIAKGVVEAHGGRIWVQSQQHEGTTFYFTLPAPR